MAHFAGRRGAETICLRDGVRRILAQRSNRQCRRHSGLAEGASFAPPRNDGGEFVL
jgi:hypothetical protein